MTDQLHFPFSLWCIGEGNGNPFQCSCLENPGDGGAWWAAVYGVKQSQTRLKRLSSSSSRLVIAFLPRSKRLLISWLQSPSAVILEPQNKIFHCFHCFPMYLPWSDGKVKSLSRVQLFATPWTAAYQAPLSMGFSRQEYWSGLPFPSPGDLPHPGIESRSPAL